MKKRVKCFLPIPETQLREACANGESYGVMARRLEHARRLKAERHGRAIPRRLLRELG